MNIFHVIVLAIIEGLTEFLPVSSTGHMVVASSMMGIGKDEFVKRHTISSGTLFQALFPLL
jgi:undecaprenyl-diphosphatase